MWNIDSLYNSGWYITIKVWKTYNGKFEVVPFSIKLTIGVKVEVNVKKWGRCNCFCCFFYLEFFFWVYDQNPIRKFGLLFHRTSRKVWRYQKSSIKGNTCTMVKRLSNMNHTKNWGELWWFKKVRSSSSTNGICRFTATT